MDNALVIGVLAECDEFKTHDKKPALVFDGRNVRDRNLITEIGFFTEGIE